MVRGVNTLAGAGPAVGGAFAGTALGAAARAAVEIVSAARSGTICLIKNLRCRRRPTRAGGTNAAMMPDGSPGRELGGRAGGRSAAEHLRIATKRMPPEPSPEASRLRCHRAVTERR